jgi:uridine phosphorylase
MRIAYGVWRIAKSLAIQIRNTHPLGHNIPMNRLYHIGFSRDDLGPNPPTIAIVSGDPDRAKLIAQTKLSDSRVLSEHRGLNSYVGFLNGKPLLSATSGMGAPSLSIVVNELVQVGIHTIIRVGTCGSIQEQVLPGSVVITKAALCRQGAANDIAPAEYPASADPFVTVALAEAAKASGSEHHIGITASVDTFYEGQERSGSANPHLLRSLQGITEEYRNLRVLNYEMEAGTLFKMGNVYGFAAGCVCGVVAQRTKSEGVVLESKGLAVERAIQVALGAAERLGV